MGGFFHWLGKCLHLSRDMPPAEIEKKLQGIGKNLRVFQNLIGGDKTKREFVEIPAAFYQKYYEIFTESRKLFSQTSGNESRKFKRLADLIEYAFPYDYQGQMFGGSSSREVLMKERFPPIIILHKELSEKYPVQ